MRIQYMLKFVVQHWFCPKNGVIGSMAIGHRTKIGHLANQKRDKTSMTNLVVPHAGR